MKHFDAAHGAHNSERPFKIVIEGKEYTTTDQYKTGAELKKLAGIPLDVDLYLSIRKPYKDELIENDKSVDLAREGIEKFFVKDSFAFTFNGVKLYSYKKDVTGKEIFQIAGIEHTSCYTLYQKLKGCDFEKISLDENIDLSSAGIEEFITKDADTFVYSLDGEHEMTDKKSLTPKQILDFGGVDSDKFYLVQKLEAGAEKVYAYSYDEKIQMDCKGNTFITRAWLEIADVEEFGKKCELIPPAKSYKIKIDKNYHVVKGKTITHNELIVLGGKTDIAQYDVYKFMNGNPKPIKILPNETVDLTEQCLVRFVLQPKEQRDGRGTRQAFILPDEDVEALESMGLQWETLSTPGKWIIIYDYPIPDGYNVDKADVALMITPSYPATEIDMAYFYPPLSKNDKKSINATTNQVIDGKNFQRWSRHRKPGEWVPGIDNISTHLCLVDNWLINDLKR
ncbi:multiubiquitin domain-containing protein [Flavobacterium mekongense]|uniref:multiubiquitin domain-containing protein n=1 Tax=Flavobacterium mekongense TaxID=3379707 RepID=UPI003999F7F9